VGAPVLLFSPASFANGDINALLAAVEAIHGRFGEQSSEWQATPAIPAMARNDLLAHLLRLCFDLMLNLTGLMIQSIALELLLK
jgi:hypothetical protein